MRACAPPVRTPGLCAAGADPCSGALTCNEGAQTCDALPVFLVGPDDFESGFGGWVNVGGDDQDWTRDSGGTPSNTTGPNVDHTTGSSGGYYLYTEASGNNTGYPSKVFLLESACVDLSGMSSAEWTFWYHMTGDNIGSLNMEADVGCTGSYTTLSSIVGEQQAEESSAFLQENLDLSAYVGQSVRLRFRAVSGTSWRGDITIDDVFVEATPE